MTRQITTLLLGLALLAGVFPVYAADQPVLLELQKQEGLSSTRISLIFDRVPEFSSEHSGQRLDILLNNAGIVLIRFQRCQ